MADKKRIQERTVSFNKGEVKLRDNTDGKKMITGQAIVYERESDPIYGSYIEVIKRGALDDADISRVVARTGHDNNNLLGTSWAGTLRLLDTASALEYEVDIPDTNAGRDTEVYMERGDIAASSFAFISDTSAEVWVDRSNEKMLPILEIHKIKSLHDVSPVLNPAYPDATSRLRSFDEWCTRTAEEALEKTKEVEKQEKNRADSDILTAIHNQLKLKKQ